MSARLHAAADRLCNVLAAENHALAALDFARIGVFHDEKRAALVALENLAADAVDPDATRDPLLEDRLQGLVTENRRLLERAIMVQTRIMAVLASAARTAQAPVGYGSKGRPPPSGGTGAVALILRA